MTIVGGAIVLASAFTASSNVQRYSDWSAPINLGPVVNSTATDRGPAISKDGLSLYFASTRVPGSFGGEDIYVSQRESQDSEWGPPVNLGPTINTTANEMVPAFSRDGHLMFFASNRPGSAGVDIWVSRRQQTHDDFGWQPPENLGAGVKFVDRVLRRSEPTLARRQRGALFPARRPAGEQHSRPVRRPSRTADAAREGWLTARR